MKVDGITLLAMARDNELKPKTILRTEHEKQYVGDKDYDYYIYHGDNQFHRCDEKGKIGAKYQNRFLNYEVLYKEFELIKSEEEKDIEELEKDVEYIEHPEKEYPDRIEKRYYYDKDKMGNKINELVRELNKIKKEGK